jgi:tRNA threonylcarbamoyladenosine biosynthesis protein TsaE
LGERLGRLLRAGDVIALVGPLGVGKTVLAKGIGRGLLVREEVLSPSFNIVLEYAGRLPYRHIDFYRLKDAGEAFDIGIEEYVEWEGVTVIEWADRIASMLPSEHLRVDMAFRAGDERGILLRPRGRHFNNIMRSITKK